MMSGNSTYDSESSKENEEMGEYDYFNYFCPETDGDDREHLYPRWRNTPRSPEDFVPSKTTISSCRDSDYERWLEEYYNDVVTKSLPSFADHQCDTSDLLPKKKSREFVKPVFPPLVTDSWSESPKYWGPKVARRHWPLRKGNGKFLFYPSKHPNLNLRSRYGRFHSQLYTTAAVPEIKYRSAVCSIFKRVLESLLVHDVKLVKLLNCNNLYNLKWLDFMTRKSVLRCLSKYLRTQHHLEKVVFENAGLERIEAITILCALSRSAGDSLRELHIWKMFDYGQCPLLLNELPERKSSSTQNKTLEFFTKIHYLQILCKFSCLTHLSVNYAYLATPGGDGLLCLKSLRTGTLKELRILCLKEERPLLTNPGYGVGGWLITDGTWRRAAEWCPDLRVKFVFLNLPQYENVILFLSKSIPVSSVYISSGTTFEYVRPWEIDSTLLELRNWYSETLGACFISHYAPCLKFGRDHSEFIKRFVLVESLSLHLWHHRDLLDVVIKSKILDEFPNLSNFEFIGVVEDVETLNEFCCRLCSGNYKLKTLLFWIQERHANPKKLEAVRRRVSEIRDNYRRMFQAVDIDADLQIFDEERSEKMDGKVLKVSLDSMPPYISYDEKNSTVILKGIFGELWSMLENRLDFQSEYLKENYKVGISRFGEGIRDALLHPVAVLANPTNDFALPITDIWYNVYYKRSPRMNSSNAFLRTWSVELWISTIILVFFIVVLLFVMLKVSSRYSEVSEEEEREPYEILRQTRKTTDFMVRFSSLGIKKTGSIGNVRNGSHLKKRSTHGKSLGHCFMTVIAGMLSQDIDIYTNVVSVRILIFVFLAFGIILDTAYSGLLISQLTLAGEFLPFTKVSEIPKLNVEYSLCVRPQTYPHFQLLTDKTNRDTWKEILNKKPCPKRKGFEPANVCVSNVAYLEIPTIMEKHLEKAECQMAKLSKKYFPVAGSLVISRKLGMDIGKHFRDELMRYREVGILSRLEDVWLRHRKENKKYGWDGHHVQISYEHVAGVLLLYVASIGFSCLLFCIELMLPKKSVSRQTEPARNFPRTFSICINEVRIWETE